MICKNCGKELEDHAKFCSDCGTTIENNSKLESSCEQKKADQFNSILNKEENHSLNIADNESHYSDYKGNYNKKKSSKVNYVPVVLFVIAFLCFGLAIFLSTKANLFVREKRTIMIYMIGSDLESQYYAGSLDINEMINSNADFNDINLLVYTGGAKEWHNDLISSEENAIYKVTSEGLVKEKTFGKAPMGNSSTLLQFLDYSFENYKSSSYSLILWDHGGGPIYGYGLDEFNKLNQLTLVELESALDSSKFGADNKLDFIGFDACLMASSEVAYVLSPYAEYMIASQEVEPSGGWDYSFLGTINGDSKPYDIGVSIIDSFDKYYSNKPSVNGVSLSLIKLNKVKDFEGRLNELFEIMDENLELDFSTISRTRSSTKTYGKTSSTNGYDLVDVYDLVSNLPSKYDDKVNNLKSSIEDMVVYQKTDLKNTNGISIYFPYENKKNITSTMYLYKTFNFAKNYTDYIDSFAYQLTGKRLFNWNLDNTKPSINDDGIISVKISDEIRDNYSYANYTIFEKNSDGYFTPIYKGTDVTLDGNKLYTTMKNKSVVATGSDGKPVNVTALETAVGNDYIKYIIPGTLQNFDDDGGNFEILSVYFEFVVDDDHPNGTITDAIPLVDLDDAESDGMASKNNININEWKVFNLFSFKYKILDDNGNYTKNWSYSPEVVGFEEFVNNKFTVEFQDLDASKDYYCLFMIKDSQGNEYNTNIIKVKNK